MNEFKPIILSIEFINFLNMATTQTGAGGPAVQPVSTNVSQSAQESGAQLIVTSPSVLVSVWEHTDRHLTTTLGLGRAHRS